MDRRQYTPLDSEYVERLPFDEQVALDMLRTSVRNRLAKENKNSPIDIMELMSALLEPYAERELSAYEIRLVVGKVQLGVPWPELIRGL